MDYARFQYSESESYVEVYFAFYPRLIVFEQSGESYRGAVLVHTTLRNSVTGKLVIDQSSVFPVALSDTAEGMLHRTFVAHAGYAVPHGTYELTAVAVDTMMPTRRDSLNVSLELKPYGTSMGASDIELCSSVKNSTNSSDMFYKNALEVVPNPTQVFGVTSHPVLFYYLEFYNVMVGEPLKLHAQLLDMSGKVIRESSKNKTFNLKSTVEAGMINVSAIESGKYILRLAVREENGKEVVRTERVVFLHNPHIAPSAPASDLNAAELAGLTEDEIDMEFQQAQYVATGSDIASYSRLDSLDAKRRFLAHFWTEVGKGRAGKIVISRRDYLRRVKIADGRFRAFTRPGWKTDRGRIFILYSEPDEIERVPSSDYGKPNETWQYYQIENGVQFVFIDRTGFGDYVLVHSTKRGELRDDNWQRLLQQ